MNWFITNIETLTTIVLALNVFLCACNNKWNWPIGLVGVTMYGMSAWFLWGLYADALLQIFYLLTGIIGWWYWVKGNQGTEAPVTNITWTQVSLIVLIVSFGTLAIGNLLDCKTDSVVPYMDAYTTIICLVAQILLMLRKRQAWILWVMANVVYVYMFHIKGLDQLAILYVAFIGNAAFGFWKWSRDMVKK